MATSASMCSIIVRGFRGLSSSTVHRCTRQSFLSRHMSTTNEHPNEKTKPENAEVPEDGTAENDITTKLTEMEKAFAVEKEDLQKQISDYKDKYTRSLAEAENVRQRMLKQVSDAKTFGIQGFCKDLLEVADILGAATTSVPKEAISEDNPHLKSLYEGLSMTELQLQKVLTKNGLNQINPATGEKFDPHRHEALFQQTVEGKESDTVAVVTKVGYHLHERTIRPALVGVYK